MEFVFFDVTFLDRGIRTGDRRGGSSFVAGMIYKWENYVSHLKSLVGGLHGLVHGLVDGTGEVIAGGQGVGQSSQEHESRNDAEASHCEE